MSRTLAKRLLFAEFQRPRSVIQDGTIHGDNLNILEPGGAQLHRNASCTKHGTLAKPGTGTASVSLKIIIQYYVDVGGNGALPSAPVLGFRTKVNL
jgi:hypothetical protein